MICQLKSDFSNSVSNYSMPQFTCVQKSPNIGNIIVEEGIATIRNVLPAMMTWVWRKYISNEIKTIPIQIIADKVAKTAYLNIHGDLKDKTPVIMCHGDFSHPCSMLHLVDISQKAGHPTFSLYIPGVDDNTYFDIHDSLLKKAIDKIEQIVTGKFGRFEGVLGVGHSKGAILLAHREFVALDPRLKAVCSIAGRLRIPNENDCSYGDLKAIVNTIYEGIVAYPERPLVKIIPKEDWNASYESMAVRPLESCFVVPGMHLSGLYSNETKEHFSKFLGFSIC